MLINRLRHFILLGIFVRRFEESTVSSMTFSNDSLVRSGRDVGTKYLIFPQGSNVQLVFCLTISTYAKPQGMFTIGSTAGLAWELPYRNTVLYGKPAEVYHRRSRRELYHKVELMLRTQGKDGKACVLKAICKAAGRRREDVGKGSFLEETLHAIFTLPGGQYDIDPMTEYERAYHLGENCDEMHAKCPGVF
ncbi:PREDICTED: uncharacterized protein LOC108754478 [Trachymyrmex septentrionalis]|uniref:uncharacterized protein LOC108754478 n=1 Tax=Trachymyrmex septentrionalis TaxID=34720 RepID=UPI00084EFE9D|nr:PREDICTED: uncharacterized protein LOC108754478 [Trachymyrmex septentrionalis]